MKEKIKTKKWLKYTLIVISIVAAFTWLNNLSFILTKSANPAIILFLLLIIIALLFWAIHKAKEIRELEFQNEQQNIKLQEEMEDLNAGIEEMEMELNRVTELAGMIEVDILEEDPVRMEEVEEIKGGLKEVKKWLKETRKKTTEKIKLFEEEINQL